MSKNNKQSNALKILQQNYVAGSPEREAKLDRERLNAKVARLIFCYREEAGLTQKQLAELVGTTQSVISRLEDADYEGHSLSMLNKIAQALNRKLSIDMAESGRTEPELYYVFQKLLYLCRRKRGWSVEEAAEHIGIEADELYSLERSERYKPSSSVLYKISKTYEIPQEKLAVLIGAFKRVPLELAEEAARFVADSDSCDRLTADEKRLMDDFIKLLKYKF
jgi:transcriptional regulator with XRE-family HTH domain